MEVTERFTEVVDILAALAPTTANGTQAAHTSGYVDMADYHRAFVWLHVGTPGGASTIAVTLQQAKTAAGGSTKELTDITGVTGTKAPTTLTTADAGTYVGIEINSAELDATNGFHFIQATVTVGVSTYTYSLVIFGLVSRYEPVGVTDYQEVVA